MYSIDIIAVGNLKEVYLKDACKEYTKRLSPYARVSYIEIKEEPFTNVNEREKIVKREEDRIRKHIKKDSWVVILDADGKEFSSHQFSGILKQKGEQGRRITFVIGGALGFSDEFKKEYEALSLSRLTFPHQLARIVLLEQLYRSMTLLHGKQYHY